LEEVRKKEKVSFEVPDSSLLDVAQFQLVKGDFVQENIIAHIFKIEQWKKVCLFLQNFNIYFKIP
jgi:hypothetical protein